MIYRKFPSLTRSDVVIKKASKNITPRSIFCLTRGEQVHKNSERCQSSSYIVKRNMQSIDIGQSGANIDKQMRNIKPKECNKLYFEN